MHVAVGPDELTVTTIDDGPLVERKVPLPGRWLRGFAEAQVITAPFEPRAEVSGAEATAFLRRLPSGSDAFGALGGAGRAVPAADLATGAGCGLPARSRSAGRAAAVPAVRHRAARAYGPAGRSG